jgi:hypothetical protein
MKTVYVWLLLVSVFPKTGVCQKSAQTQEDAQITMVRMQDRLDRLDAEVQRLRDKMVQVTDRLSATQTAADDNSRDIGFLRYAGGGFLFVAGVFVAELMKRMATRVSFRQAKPD